MVERTKIKTQEEFIEALIASLKEAVDQAKKQEMYLPEKVYVMPASLHADILKIMDKND